MTLKKMSRMIFATLVGAAWAQTMRGQPQADTPPDVVTAIANTRQLSVTITTDREIYLGGEDAVLTITVVNPTYSRVKVLEPFRMNTGGIDLMQRNLVDPQHRPWLNLYDHSLGAVRFSSRTPLATLEPQQRIEKRFHFYEPQFDAAYPTVGYRAVPVKEGEYQLVYGYGQRARTTFKVVTPKLLKIATVPFVKTKDHKNYNGTHVLLKRHVWVLEFQIGNEYIVAATVDPSIEHIPIDVSPDGRVSESDLLRLSPYVRVATLLAPTASLQAVADTDENVAITWADSNGKSSRVVLDPQRNPK